MKIKEIQSKLTEQAQEIERLKVFINNTEIYGTEKSRDLIAAKDKELSDLREQKQYWIERYNELEQQAGEAVDADVLRNDNTRLREALEKASSLLAFGKSLIHHLPRQNEDTVEAHPQADLYDVDCVNLRKEISTLTAALSTVSEDKLKEI